MIGGLKQAVLLQRAADYCNHYKPQLIGVSAGWGRQLTAHALAFLLADYTRLRVSGENRMPADVAAAVLGVPSKTFNWVSLLARSRVREATGREPQTIIVDVPAGRPGDVDVVSAALPFTGAVLANIHSSHLKSFLDTQTVAHEHLSLPASLKQDGVVVLNVDDPLLAAFSDNCTARVVGFGETAAADVRMTRMHRMSDSGFAVELQINSRIIEIRLPHLFSSLQVYSVIAALAMFYAITENPSATANAAVSLAQFQPPYGQGSKHIKEGVTIYADIDATPESILSGLYALSHAGTRTIAILGDIQDLGGKNNYWHERIGREAASAVDIFMAVGEDMRVAQTAALTSKDETDVHHFERAADAGKWIRQYLRADTVVFVAGSSGMQMGDVVDRLLNSKN